MPRILIVDDKEENRYYLEALFRAKGFAVDSARHGAEALTLARQSPPAVVISDLLMPVMDGYTLLRHWKADLRLRNVPFIVYTATYTEPQDERLALDLGADAFILKPAEPDAIFSRVQEVALRIAAMPATTVQAPSDADEAELLKLYSGTLIRKLEEKTLQLEQANQALQRDIEERKAVEVALRESEAELRTLADAVPHIVWVNLADGRNIYLNRYGLDYTGLTLEQTRADRWVPTIHPEDRQIVLGAWRQARQDERAYSVEGRLQRADGAYRWCLIQGVPRKDDAGKTLKWFGTCTDIHDLRETQLQLQQAQRMEVIGQLTGGVAHDFNNILNVILANVEALEEDNVSPREQVRRLAGISRSVDRASDLIRQLLAFSRKQSLKPQPTDINALVTAMGMLLRRALGERIELRLSLAETLWLAHIDRSQIESALVNLCVNARDAMPEGGTITVETRNVSIAGDAAARNADAVPGDFVLVAVSDTGTGMTPDVLAQVFEPFFTTKQEGKGTGLGLSMVYGFIRQSGGHVEIDSEPGRGTSVRLFLPRGAGELEQAPEKPGAIALKGSHRVLLVEDDPDVRASVLMQLHGLGIEVTEASGGAAAVVAMENASRPFDVLLTDVVMPGAINGRKLADEAARRWPQTRIVFMSGYAEERGPLDSRLPSDALLLKKPFRKAELAAILNQALDLREMAEAPSGRP
jgi:PAS domain S-box-containing protein